jgi:hypothetical protein
VVVRPKTEIDAWIISGWPVIQKLSWRGPAADRTINRQRTVFWKLSQIFRQMIERGAQTSNVFVRAALRVNDCGRACPLAAK